MLCMVRPTVGVQRAVGENPQKSTQSTQKWSEEIPADSLEISAYQKSHSTCWGARKYFFLAHLDWRVEYCGYWDAASVDLHPLIFWPHIIFLFQKQQLQAVPMDNENSTRNTNVCRVICNSLSTFQFSSYLFIFFSTALHKRRACINGNMAHTKNVGHQRTAESGQGECSWKSSPMDGGDQLGHVQWVS